MCLNSTKPPPPLAEPLYGLAGDKMRTPSERLEPTNVATKRVGRGRKARDGAALTCSIFFRWSALSTPRSDRRSSSASSGSNAMSTPFSINADAYVRSYLQPTVSNLRWWAVPLHEQRLGGSCLWWVRKRHLHRPERAQPLRDFIDFARIL